MGERLVEDLTAALGEQTVTVPGTAATETVLPRLADQLRQVLDQSKRVATEVEGILDAHPLAHALTSMPGFGVRTTARVLLDIGDGSAFPTAGHLAAYAGLAPITRRSGLSIRGEHPARGGNKTSNTPSSSPPSRACPTPSAEPTMTPNAPKENSRRVPGSPVSWVGTSVLAWWPNSDASGQT